MEALILLFFSLYVLFYIVIIFGSIGLITYLFFKYFSLKVFFQILGFTLLGIVVIFSLLTIVLYSL